MKIEHVNPFVNATVDTLKTMCNVDAKRNGDLKLTKDGLVEANDIIGVIGLTGGLKGAVLMTMAVEVGQKMIGAFLMEEVNEINADLLDGFGEIINIIAGQAAGQLEGYNVKLAIPTVMVGKNQQIHAKQSNPWVIIPMKISDWGEFKIEVNMEEA